MVSGPFQGLTFDRVIDQQTALENTVLAEKLLIVVMGIE
jgi:hypothetical protein